MRMEGIHVSKGAKVKRGTKLTPGIPRERPTVPYAETSSKTAQDEYMGAQYGGKDVRT